MGRAPGSARSAQLPLSPLQLYEVSATMARGPGSALRFAITYVDARGKPQEWYPTWQLPAAVRSSAQPLSPRAQAYVQGFVLPPGASQARLLLRLDPAQQPQLARYSRWELTALRIEALQSVRCCQRLGADRVPAGDFEGPPEDGMPLGWQQPGRTPDDRLQLVTSNDPARGHVLQAAGRGKYLASSAQVPVTRGQAYRLSLQARGRGQIQLVVHALSRELPMQQRVTNGRTPHSFDLQTSQWTELSAIWFAEEAHIAAAQPVIVLLPQTELEVDAIELRPLE